MGVRFMTIKKTQSEVTRAPDDSTNEEESFLFFLTVLRRKHPDVFNSMIFFFTLLGRVHSSLGSLTNLFQGMTLHFHREGRVLLCDITDRIVIQRMEGGQVVGTHVVLGWTSCVPLFQWLFKGEV